MDIHSTGKGLPENAYRKLKDGEAYSPVVPENAPLPDYFMLLYFQQELHI